MKKKVLVSAVLIFVSYNLVLSFFPSIMPAYTNLERAEEFVYSRKKYSVVFIGSGLIGDLNRGPLSRPIYFNLFLPFSGSCDGAEIIVRSGKVPDTLLVETNCVFKGESKELLGQLYRPGLYELKRVFPAFQTKYNAVSRLLKKADAIKLKSSPDFQEDPGRTRGSALSDYVLIGDTTKLNQDVERLFRNLEVMSSRGSVVVFFEVPMPGELSNSPKLAYQRKTLRRVFSSQKYQWIPPDTASIYSSPDGLHLDKESAQMLFVYLNQHARSL